jgi:hypothetical protein
VGRYPCDARDPVAAALRAITANCIALIFGGSTIRADGDVCPCFKKKQMLHIAIKEMMITAVRRTLLSLLLDISTGCEDVLYNQMSIKSKIEIDKKKQRKQFYKTICHYKKQKTIEMTSYER